MDRGLGTTVVVSAVSFTQGGPLTILRAFLTALRKAAPESWRITVLVHDTALVDGLNVEAIAVPYARRTWLHRLYAEWFGLRGLVNGPVRAWVSLHDITPRVRADLQYVYCHNSAAFYRPSLHEAFLEPTIFAFSMLYRWVYRLAIGRNRAIIVQQDWMRHLLQVRCNARNVWVSSPTSQTPSPIPSRSSKGREAPFIFLYPALPRAFKNHEIVLQACEKLRGLTSQSFEVWFTAKPHDNRYTRWLAKRSQNLTMVRWKGLLTQSDLMQAYADCDVVLFPSKLETWGLPISEGKAAGKPLMLANLPYAHETLGDYATAAFFDPSNAETLATLMLAAINAQPVFQPHHSKPIAEPKFDNWDALAKALVADISNAA